MQLEDIKEVVTLDPLERAQFTMSMDQMFFSTISPRENRYLSVRGIQGCRSFLHDDLRKDYLTYMHERKVFEEKPYRLFVAFQNDNAKTIITFLKNWEWFVSWQQHLGRTTPVIKRVNPHTAKQDKNTRLYLELDPIWQQSILQNSFCTFILRCMAYHLFQEKINFEALRADVQYREKDYLNQIQKEKFFFYLNHIHQIKPPKPFGNISDDFWVHHDEYGFVSFSDKLPQQENFQDFTKSLGNYLAA